MTLTAGFILLLVGFIGIDEGQTASVAKENDIWRSLSEADDKRDIEVDNTDIDEHLPTDEDLGYDDFAFDADEDTDYYRYIIQRRAGCADVFVPLCARLGKNRLCNARRKMRFAKKFCHHSCPQYCS